jgi:hypothetical protein
MYTTSYPSCCLLSLFFVNVLASLPITVSESTYHGFIKCDSILLTLYHCIFFPSLFPRVFQASAQFPKAFVSSIKEKLGLMMHFMIKKIKPSII